ncbi:hypothetical protein LTR17_010884 [Elasticomyces elasticus]|nr:hypothetical protein LTR17_010884 [Elasticomyces elasticus]
MAYPSTQQIKDIFQAGESGSDGFMKHVDANVVIDIVGHDHELSHKGKGADSLKDNHFAEFENMLDFSKPNQLDIIRVIGGGDSSWACVEVKAAAKTKKGKEFNNECCFVINFNKEGKIVELRAYYDSEHVNGHIKEHKGQSGGKKN